MGIGYRRTQIANPLISEANIFISGLPIPLTLKNVNGLVIEANFFSQSANMLEKNSCNHHHHHIYLFIYLPSDVISQEKTATSSRYFTKVSKHAIPSKPNTQTCRVKAIFSHLVRRQRRTERSSKSTATSPS